MPPSDRAAVMQDLCSKDPTTKLLYLTPELLSSAWFRPALQTLFERKRLAMFAIDEAHCISRFVSFARHRRRCCYCCGRRLVIMACAIKHTQHRDCS